ncbi:LIC_11090 family protein [Leptospira alstonii]|uniref:Lipoprotein n=2 Tax=Leptospira alstonii TaxID=28452 RepID=T0FZM0_9LEPT|nr:hypothetical protein [Leptospira alstonii]EMJ94530.1 putative lipoprotein [Leptospira alstonii serovar Sichuan str. 79601]EQA79442.1 putative lipoprotein [Leptospira alstonii serovar Pingchang str. 80-412]
MKFYLSLLLSASILFQAVVFSSGLFGCILAEKAKICECNHGSRIQKHSNEEDKRFSKKVRSDRPSLSSDKLPNCHSAKSGEIHSCSCKKAENKLSQLGAFYSALFSPKQNSDIEHVLHFIQMITLEYSNSEILSFSSPFKPPRFS